MGENYTGESEGGLGRLTRLAGDFVVVGGVYEEDGNAGAFVGRGPGARRDGIASGGNEVRGAIRVVALQAESDGEIVTGGSCVEGVIAGVDKNGDEV